jgi:hypothetical protein
MCEYFYISLETSGPDIPKDLYTYNLAAVKDRTSSGSHSFLVEQCWKRKLFVSKNADGRKLSKILAFATYSEWLVIADSVVSKMYDNKQKQERRSPRVTRHAARGAT